MVGKNLTDNEIKYLIKLIKSLENRGILLKETTRKNTSHEGRFLNFLRAIMTAGLPLIKDVLISLPKSTLISLGFAAAASAADLAIQKNIFGSGTTALIISNEEMEDIVKIVKLIEESGLILKGISETVANKAKEQKDGFLPMLLGTLVVSLLRSGLTGWGAIRASEGVKRAGQKFLYFLIL